MIAQLQPGRGAGNGAPAAAGVARQLSDLHLCFRCTLAPGLAQNRFLDDPAFVHYLKYLEYWRQPQYAKYIR